MTEMKKSFKCFAIAAAALIAAACTMEISSPVETPVSDTFVATIESKATRTAIGDDNYTVWSEEDCIAVFNEEYEMFSYSLVDGEGTAKGTFETSSSSDDIKVKKTAVYPYDEENGSPCYSEGVLSIRIPYDYWYDSGSINYSPMVGVFEEGGVKFKNAGALIRVDVKNIPAGIYCATITSEDVNLAGWMTFDSDFCLTPGEFDEDYSSASIYWGANEEKCDKVFYFPIPVATFKKLTISLTDGKQTYVIKEKENFTSERNTRYTMSYDVDEAVVEDELEIKDEDDLFWLAEQVAGGRTFKGETVKLAADITMTKAWTPIGLGGQNDPTFMGTFDGQGYTISNLTVEAAEYPAFFGRKYCGDVLNVKFDKATVTGNHYGAVIVGWTDDTNYTWDGAKEKFKIHGCEVTNSTVTLSPEYTGTKWDNGDKAGAIVGYAYSITVSNNKVSNTTITGYRDLGGVVGAAIASGECFTTVSGNEVGENVIIVVDNSLNYKNFTEAASYNLGSVWGRNEATNGAVNKLQENGVEATLVPPVARNLVFAADNATAVVGEDCKEPVLNGTTDGVTYSSSDETVATVDANGNVTAKKAGTVTITATAPDTKTLFAGSASYTLTVKEILYLVPNSNWTQDNARFAAYFFGLNDIKEWVSMADSNEDGIYEVEIPAGGYTTVIFCRMNPATNVNDWGSNGSHKWNQTGDMTIGQEGRYCIIPPYVWDGSMVWSDSSTNIPFVTNDKIFLIPFNDWKNDNAKFTVTFKNGSTTKTVNLTVVPSCPSYYEATIPSGTWQKVKFNRMAPTNNTTWNSTNDVSLSNNNCFEVTGWNAGDVVSHKI